MFISICIVFTYVCVYTSCVCVCVCACVCACACVCVKVCMSANLYVSITSENTWVRFTPPAPTSFFGPVLRDSLAISATSSHMHTCAHKAARASSLMLRRVLSHWRSLSLPLFPPRSLPPAQVPPGGARPATAAPVGAGSRSKRPTSATVRQ